MIGQPRSIPRNSSNLSSASTPNFPKVRAAYLAQYFDPSRDRSLDCWWPSIQQATGTALYRERDLRAGTHTGHHHIDFVQLRRVGFKATSRRRNHFTSSPFLGAYFPNDPAA